MEGGSVVVQVVFTAARYISGWGISSIYLRLELSICSNSVTFNTFKTIAIPSTCTVLCLVAQLCPTL